MKTEIINLLIDLLVVMSLSCIPILTKTFSGYIEKFATTNLNSSTCEIMKMILIEISDAVETAVKATNQTFVDSIKNSDNPFTKEAQEMAFRKSYDVAISLLSQDAKDYIEETFSSIENYITSKIEAEVQKQKILKEYMILPEGAEQT